jgi:flavodoxin/Pyruvate/2-oxoacid:ferredoxin oxidoreductase delta subunit
MKIGIACFSGTGTTLMFAHEIAKGLEEKGHEVEISRLHRMNPIDLEKYDIIGFGTPTYSFTIPSNVGRFLNSLNSLKKPYFLFATCGGQPGNTIAAMHSTVKERLGPLLGFVIGLGRTGNIRAWRPTYDKPEPKDGLSESEIKKANEFGRNLPDLYQKIAVEKTMKSPKISYSILTGFVNTIASYEYQMRILEGNKKVDHEKCTKCGLCAEKICPSGSITQKSKDDFPEINNKTCFGCSGCVNLCPVLAIYSNKNENKHPYKIYAKYIFK